LGIHKKLLLSSIIRSPAPGMPEGARRFDPRCFQIKWM
jgi:hypothetical protein